MDVESMRRHARIDQIPLLDRAGFPDARARESWEGQHASAAESVSAASNYARAAWGRRGRTLACPP